MDVLHYLSIILSAVSPPMIVSITGDTSVALGREATFTVDVDFDEDGTITYEWLFNSISLTPMPAKYSGIDQASLLILNVQDSDIGMYSVRVTPNVGDTVMSSIMLSICEFLTLMVYSYNILYIFEDRMQLHKFGSCLFKILS